MDEARRRLDEAREVLVHLGMPKARQNTRSALCLLALLNLTPDKTWEMAENPLLGITPVMDWAATHYGVAINPTPARRSGAKPCTGSWMREWFCTIRTILSAP
jgi:hypothetical protein